MMNRNLMCIFLLALGLLIVCPFKIGVVLGSSMSPTLGNHQVIVIHRNWYRNRPVNTGDVVVLQHSQEMLVKRVIATAGDTLWELRDPLIGSFELIDERAVPRVQATLMRSPKMGSLMRVEVPEGHVYVVGDSGTTSLDSRSFGPVPVSAIIGRVVSPAATARNTAAEGTEIGYRGTRVGM
jgi:signal peptidase I